MRSGPGDRWARAEALGQLSRELAARSAARARARADGAAPPGTDAPDIRHLLRLGEALHERHRRVLREVRELLDEGAAGRLADGKATAPQRYQATAGRPGHDGRRAAYVAQVCNAGCGSRFR